jgi:MoaA/NifB/PqqE/SkfB family radical SAM enzyme
MNVIEMMDKILFLGSKIVNFDEKCVFFAINNTCNNKCKMCSIWKIKSKKVVKYEDAKKALDILHQNRFSIVQLTGGEPFLNPDIFNIINYAKKLRFIILIASNGTMITESVSKKLAKSKVEQVSISFHHYKPEIFENIEGHKNILNKVLKCIDILKKDKVPVSALCAISRYNMNEIEDIVDFIEKLGIVISFSMPVNVNKTSYALGGSCANLQKNELEDAVLRIIKLKKEGHNIANNMSYLRNVVRSLEGKNKYFCYGGSKLFYLDWNLNLFPCMFKGKGTKITEDFFDGVDRACDDCQLQCFREPSLFLNSRIETVKLLLKDSPYYLNMFKKGFEMFSD